MKKLIIFISVFILSVSFIYATEAPYTVEFDTSTTPTRMIQRVAGEFYWGASTTTPSVKISSYTSYFNDCKTGFGTSSPTGKVEVSTGTGSYSLWIDSDSVAVGIGNNSPTAGIELEVTGDIKSTTLECVTGTVTDLTIDNITVAYGVEASTGVFDECFASTFTAKSPLLIQATQLIVSTDTNKSALSALTIAEGSGEGTFAQALNSPTLNTGQGDYELYAMNQNVLTTSSPTFATVNTGQGANELYDMNQNVLTTSSPTFATVDTGQGANELYDMNQNVLTTSTPTFSQCNITNALTAGSLDITELETSTITAKNNDLLIQGENINFSTDTNKSNLSAMYIEEGTGDIGINTINPSSELEVNGDIEIQNLGKLRFDGDPSGDTYIYESASPSLRLRSAGVDQLDLTGTEAYLVIGTISGKSDVQWDSATNRLGYVVSSIRYKKDIKDYEDVLDRVNKLKPVKFKFKIDDSDGLGLIAEEVYPLFPEIVSLNKNGGIETVTYSQLSIILLKAIQEQQNNIDILQHQIAINISDIELLKQRIEILENK